MLVGGRSTPRVGAGLASTCLASNNKLRLRYMRGTCDSDPRISDVTSHFTTPEEVCREFGGLFERAPFFSLMCPGPHSMDCVCAC